MSRPEAGGVPAGAGEPAAFDEPWQAQAFALVVALHERGVLTWPEWAEALGAQVNRADAAADGHDYYRHWLAALEALLDRKGIALPARVDDLADAWQRAARATPHGSPILLANDPLS